MSNRLYQRIEELEVINAHAEGRAGDVAARLETARAALEQEVKKRIWAERELTATNLRLHDQAVRDPLTGLYNRRYLEESLDREISRARRSGLPLALMMIDIDYFKSCNDRFGHAAGDEALRAVGRHIQALARGEDIVCRFGGEEFVLVMTHASSRALQERAEMLRAGASKLRIVHDGRDIGPLTLSVGVAILSNHAGSGQSVLEAADAALYSAKQAGRDRIVVAEESRARGQGDGADVSADGESMA
jgi:diguanylate cyclase (GGDEF)-like protein